MNRDEWPMSSKARPWFGNERKLKKQCLFERQEGKCAKCGKEFSINGLTFDHIVPLCRDGTNDMPNLQLLCKPCNSRKGKNMDTKQVGRQATRCQPGPIRVRVVQELIKRALNTHFMAMSENEIREMFEEWAVPKHNKTLSNRGIPLLTQPEIEEAILRYIKDRRNR